MGVDHHGPKRPTTDDFLVTIHSFIWVIDQIKVFFPKSHRFGGDKDLSHYLSP